MDASFFQAPVAVPKLSGFDKSFQNLYTAKVGTLVPALCDELMPGSIVDLDIAASVSLPPLASDTFMRCSLKVEAFFVPMRLCFGGFEHWFVQDEFDVMQGLADFHSIRNQFLPCFTFGAFNDVTDPQLTWDLSEVFGAGTLADYLGFKGGPMKTVRLVDSAIQGKRWSLMPYIAYHKCWSDWYRSSLVQKDCFAPLDQVDWNSTYYSPANAPFSSDPAPLVLSPLASADADFGNGVLKFSSLAGTAYELADGVNVFQLRQRNFGFDFFTCATPSPQNGPVARVSTAVSGDPANSFTISQLRSMNSLQQWRERNNLTGDRYVDRLYGQYGCRPSDGIAQRVLCLGSADIEVYNKGIYMSNNNDGNGSPASQNPFGQSLGARGGSAYGTTEGAINLCHGFKAAEPGYLFVITSLVPRVTYATGLDYKLTRYTLDGSIGEMPNPILQNIGPEPIYVNELIEDVFDTSRVFGYTDRYGRFKNKFDELHGLVRDGESLESFALQRYLDPSNIMLSISDEFLQIPTGYMDNVTAVAADISTYGCWIDSYFRYRVSMPLAKYSLPSLQDPAYEHGKTIVVRRGGFRF